LNIKVEGIKKLVQSLCQNTNPLGKSLEFLNDDIDSMNKENEYWKKQYLASKQKYQNELKSSIFFNFFLRKFGIN